MTIDQLRESLFETLQAVKNGNLDAEQAKTISDVAQTIINTAKVEIDFMKASGGVVASRFIDQRQPQLEDRALPKQMGIAEQIIGANVTKHVCR